MKLQQSNNCSIYVTAGFPRLESALTIVPELEKAGASLIELGIPFSDPMADGETIQAASAKALENGMTLSVLFDQVMELKEKVNIPLVLMGYLNPIHQYGMENFLKACQESGVAGVIIPDLPPEVYENEYQGWFEEYQVPLIFLITPKTPPQRIRYIEKLSKAFIYLVSTSSITGRSDTFSADQIEGFERIRQMNLSVPVLVGFGIHDTITYATVCRYFQGAIIGSAFIRHLNQNKNITTFMEQFNQTQMNH